MQLHGDRYVLLLPALEAKCTELRLLESGVLTPEELWRYCLKRLWRKSGPETQPLHKLVGDIMSVTLSDYVSHSQVEGFKGDNWFSGAAAEEWKQLLRPSAAKKPV